MIDHGFGGVERWDEPAFLNYVEALVEGDDVELALKALDHVPAILRENPTPAMLKMRKDITQSLYTANLYKNMNADPECMGEGAAAWVSTTLRGALVYDEVQRFNSQAKRPHIIDFGPGEYLVPLALKELGANYTYEPIYMDERAFHSYTRHPSFTSDAALPDEPTIFLAMEIIEHLPNIHEMATECLIRTQGVYPEQVHLSTPGYTFDGRRKDWRKTGGLPHLRAYTRKEFMGAAESVFPGYDWSLYFSPIMSLIGKRRGTN